MNLIKNSTLALAAIAIIFQACGGGSSSTENTNTDNTKIGIGGNTSEINCSAQFSVKDDNNTDRINKLCNYAKMIYSDNQTIFLNVDYKHADEDYIDGHIHSGVDIQAHRKQKLENKNYPIKSISNGKVIGYKESLGFLVIESVLANNEIIQIGYMHMEYAEGIKQIGKTISKGDILGYESNVGTKSNHLHLEMRSFSNNPNSALQTLKSQITEESWKYALDPIKYSDEFYNYETSINNDLVFSIDIPEKIVIGKENRLSGNIYHPKSLDSSITFEIINSNNNVLIKESFQPTPRVFGDGYAIDLSRYHFGTESNLSNLSGWHKLKTSVSRNGTTYSKIYDVLLENKNAPISIDLSNISLHNKIYFDNPIEFDGCITNASKIEEIEVEVVNNNNMIASHNFSKENFTDKSCKGIENSIDLSRTVYTGRVNYPEGMHIDLGNYTAKLKVKDIEGNTTISKDFNYELITPIKNVYSQSELKSGKYIHRFTIERLSKNDLSLKNQSQIINLSACSSLYIGGEDCNHSKSIKYNDSSEIDKIETSCDAKNNPGTYNFEIKYDCGIDSPKSTIFNGTFTYK